MDDTKSAVVMSLDNEIVQVQAFDRLYFVTRNEFTRLEKMSHMLEQLIYNVAGLSTIQQVFAKELSDEEIEARFDAWTMENQAAKDARHEEYKPDWDPEWDTSEHS